MTTPSPGAALLFRRAALIPGGPDLAPRARTDILLRAGRVAAVGPDLPPSPDAEEVPADHLLILPAFRNAHTHSPESLGRGRATRARQAEWLEAAYAGGLDALDETGIARAIAATAADTVRGGAASATDHFRQLPPSRDAVRHAAAAWSATGLRVGLAVMMRNRAMPGAHAPMPTRDLLAIAAACLAESRNGVTIGPGPSAPQRCTDDLLAGLAALAAEAGTFLHLHLCETAADAAACRALYGTSAVAHLHYLGALGPRTELAHCVHVDDGDLARMADTGTVMVHNPGANLRLGSGVAPVMAALRAGVRIRLGSDGAGSNDGLSVLDAARLACLIPRLTHEPDDWPEPADALAMATDGATLAPGEPADLLAMDLTAPAFAGTTPEEIVPRLILAARETEVVHLLAAGRPLLWDRRPG